MRANIGASLFSSSCNSPHPAMPFELTKDDIAKLIAEQGVEINHGLRGIRKEMAYMDKNGNKLLERPEFVAGLRQCTHGHR